MNIQFSTHRNKRTNTCAHTFAKNFVNGTRSHANKQTVSTHGTCEMNATYNEIAIRGRVVYAWSSYYGDWLDTRLAGTELFKL